MPPLRAPPLTVNPRFATSMGRTHAMRSPGLCVTGEQRREEEQRGPIMHACASDLLPGALMAQAHAARLRLPCTAAPAGPGAGRADDNSCRTTHCRATLHYKGPPRAMPVGRCQWRTEDRQGWQKRRGKGRRSTTQGLHSPLISSFLACAQTTPCAPRAPISCAALYLSVRLFSFEHALLPRHSSWPITWPLAHLISPCRSDGLRQTPPPAPGSCWPPC
jgi:hypothetical protein